MFVQNSDGQNFIYASKECGWGQIIPPLFIPERWLRDDIESNKTTAGQSLQKKSYWLSKIMLNDIQLHLSIILLLLPV